MWKILEREIFSEVTGHLDKKEVTIIVGARQTGKTTLLLELKRFLLKVKNISDSQIRFFNLDLITDMEALSSQNGFVSYLKEELSKEKFLYVFIDEVQKIENAGKFLKGIYDLNLPVKFIVSGSSSIEIRSKVYESLAGRKRLFYLWSFSFNEYISCRAPRLLDLLGSKPSRINEQNILQYLYEFLVFGGYPRVVLADTKEEKIQILNEIYSSYVEKDVVGFLKIRNPLRFSKLVTILAGQSGSLVNYRELCATLGLSYRTMERYISALENTFIIKNVLPYHTNVRKELTKMPKIYFADNGLMNFAIKNFTNFQESLRKGILLENFVFTTFLKKWQGSINFWRTKEKNEVDFVLKDFYGNIIPIEVKAASLKKPEITYGLRSFIKKYKPKRIYVVNIGIQQKTIIDRGLSKQSRFSGFSKNLFHLPMSLRNV